MGFGGANGHVTLEEADPDAPPAEEQLKLLGSNQASELIALSAPDLPTLQAELSRLLAVARRICLAELTDLSAVLAKRPPQGACRVAFVASTPWELADNLELVRQGLRQGAELSAIHDPASGIFAGTTVENPRWIALFPGQGSQRLNMCERFRERFPFVEDIFPAERGHPCAPGGTATAGRTGMSAPLLASAIFRDTLGAPGEQVKAWEKALRDTRTAQPAIVACSAAVLQVLDYLGLRPALAIGHSLGEITALHAAGYFDATTAVHVAALRGAAMSGLSLPDPGAMLAISEPPERVEELIGKAEGRGCPLSCDLELQLAAADGGFGNQHGNREAQSSVRGRAGALLSVAGFPRLSFGPGCSSSGRLCQNASPTPSTLNPQRLVAPKPSGGGSTNHHRHLHIDGRFPARAA
jgi:acyl transferase domain-containing protein